MEASRPVKLFRNGRNQAVRIPREYELPGDDAVMRREGDRLIIEPSQRKRTLEEVLVALAKEPPLDERLEPFVDSPPRPFSL